MLTILNYIYAHNKSILITIALCQVESHNQAY